MFCLRRQRSDWILSEGCRTAARVSALKGLAAAAKIASDFFLSAVGLIFCGAIKAHSARQKPLSSEVLIRSAPAAQMRPLFGFASVCRCAPEKSGFFCSFRFRAPSQVVDSCTFILPASATCTTPAMTPEGLHRRRSKEDVNRAVHLRQNHFDDPEGLNSGSSSGMDAPASMGIAVTAAAAKAMTPLVR